ncbi:SprT-like domain-containing protein [Brevibacillus sp. NPDC058079]|uniref:SprT-like domain-containing protein n=1 Tax=Brevibacillus sp. NPDC058079 TaxID=3346330 RepID=UPI0036E8A894
MREATLEWLEQQAFALVKKHWQRDDIPRIVIDSDREHDWTNTLAVYWNDTRTIEFKSTVNTRRTLRQIKKTLLHELCHWYLHITDQNFRDYDERFAKELIRVGAGSTHNPDVHAVKAFQKAKKRKQSETFEIIERNASEILVSRLRHHRKNQDDFKRDLKDTLIRMHNEREDDETIYPGDVATQMVNWLGYKLEPLATCAIDISKDSGFGSGEIGDREDIAYLLNQLGMDWDEIEQSLRDEQTESE